LARLVPGGAVYSRDSGLVAARQGRFAIAPEARDDGKSQGAYRAGEVPIAAKVALLLFLLLLGTVAYGGHSQWRYAQLSSALDADIATFHRSRWERQVLRGDAAEGNAAAAAWQALAAFEGLEAKQREDLAVHVYYGQPPEDGMRELIAEHVRMVDALRASTQHTWSMNELAIEQGARVTVPEYPHMVDAVLLLLATGMLEGADACLAHGVDAIRIGQDLVPGGPLEAASVAARIASLASRVVTHCAAKAEPKLMARTAQELKILAKHPPPVGQAVEAADIIAMVELREQANLYSTRVRMQPWTRLRRRGTLFEAWGMLQQPTRWRAIDASDYPKSLAAWRREQDWRARAKAPVVSEQSAKVLGWLYDDMRGQAIVRASAIAIATALEHKRRDKIPRQPIGLGDPSLRDPYSGHAMRWRVADDGSELAVWSVGEDMRDDRGTEDWAVQAPLDVVVRIALQKPAPVATDKKRKRKRRR
jgi:hypothetical protein